MKMKHILVLLIVFISYLLLFKTGNESATPVIYVANIYFPKEISIKEFREPLAKEREPLANEKPFLQEGREIIDDDAAKILHKLHKMNFTNTFYSYI
jgi:hypothetical protein